MDDRITVTVPRGFRGKLTLSLDGDSPSEDGECQFMAEGEIPRETQPQPAQVEGDEQPPRLSSPVTVSGFRGRPYYYCGHHTPVAHLEALHALVAGIYQGRLFQAAVLNEWTGEASCVIRDVFQGNGKLYAISDGQGRTADQRHVIATGGVDEIPQLLRRNATAMTDDTTVIHCVHRDPLEVVKDTEQPVYDLIFINSEEDTDTLRGLVKHWAPHLAEHGVIAGQAVTPTEQTALVKVFGDKLNVVPGTSLWHYPKSEVPV